jgi:hypothetical protein
VKEKKQYIFSKEKKRGKKKRLLIQYSRICAVDPSPTAKGAALRQQGAGEL